MSDARIATTGRELDHQGQELCPLVGLQAKTYRYASRRPDDAPICQRLLYWPWSGGGVCVNPSLAVSSAVALASGLIDLHGRQS
jgi:hypothetical protein